MANVQTAKFFDRHTNHNNGYGRISFAFPKPNQLFDAITSLAAFTGIAVMLLFFDTNEQFIRYTALLAAIFIIYNIYKIFLPPSPPVAEVFDDNLLSEIKWVGNCINGIIGLENCTITTSQNKYNIALVVLIKPNITVSDGFKLVSEFKDKLRKEIPQLQAISIFMEPYDNII